MFDQFNISEINLRLECLRLANGRPDLGHEPIKLAQEFYDFLTQTQTEPQKKAA